LSNEYMLKGFPCYECPNMGKSAPRCELFRNCTRYLTWAKKYNITLPREEEVKDG